MKRIAYSDIHDRHTDHNVRLALALEIYDAIESGKPVYVEYISGDRAGSIAKVIGKDSAYHNHKPDVARRLEGYGSVYCIMFGVRYVKVGWDDRTNVIKARIPSDECVVLLDYQGPTVWAKFDAKKAKEELLKNPNQKDINGRVLCVGDRVLYINARYGESMSLCHGTVIEFQASVNSTGHSISTLVRGHDGTDSNISNSNKMIHYNGPIDEEPT